MRHPTNIPAVRCPRCRAITEVVGQPTAADPRWALRCPACGLDLRARPRGEGQPPGPTPPPALIGSWGLVWRSHCLWLLMLFYRLGLGLGTGLGLLAGGFVPIGQLWLADAIAGWGDVVRGLGGVPIRSESVDPDADYGPTLRRDEAPDLFQLLEDLAARLDVRSPEEVRLAFLPCCGVVAWGRSRAVLIGLPLLLVLDMGEFRAILAHELSHLATGDATWVARLARAVELLDQELDQGAGRSRGPLRWWGLLCRRAALRLLGPIARGQEARADRASASLAGGSVAASGLVKVALVQPLFRELLTAFEVDPASRRTLYGAFRAFWGAIPGPLRDAMRLQLLATTTAVDSSPHPPLADRVRLLQSFADRPARPDDDRPALALLGDPDWIEQMMHDRLYKLDAIEPTVFHTSGT